MKAYQNNFSADVLKSEIQKSKPITLTALFLRLGSRYPIMRPEFLKLVDISSVAISPSEYAYHSFCLLESEMPAHLRGILWMGKTFVPNYVFDRGIRFVIEYLLTPYFLLKDERAYREIKQKYEKGGAGVIIDVVGEEALFASEAESFFQGYEYAMKEFGGKIAVKLSSLIPSVSFNSSNHEENKRMLKEKFSDILLLAEKYSVSITLDAEEYFKWCLLIEDVFCETVLEDRFQDMPNVGIALQVYRKDSLKSARRLLSVAKKRKCPLTIRVVKGAYWDTEWAIAEQSGWEYPLFKTKEETDANFDKIVSFFLHNREYIHLAVATQNPENIAHAVKETCGDFANFEIQVLYGLGEAVRRALCRLGVPVSVYCPLVRQGGSMQDALSYLVRRILENTAGNSCLLESL